MDNTILNFRILYCYNTLFTNNILIIIFMYRQKKIGFMTFILLVQKCSAQFLLVGIASEAEKKNSIKKQYKVLYI